MEKYGFVYIWYDRKRKMYYIGSHWGHENDGYVCSSKWMLKAYNTRPKDFKRKILKSIIYSRKETFEEEHKWLSMIKKEELCFKYYNKRNDVFSIWSNGDEYALNSLRKASIKKTGRKLSEETKRKMSISHLGMPGPNKGKILTEAHKAKISKSGKGRIVSKETKKKNSEAVIGSKHPMYGKYHSIQTKKAMSEKRKGKGHHFYGKICINDGISYMWIPKNQEIPNGFVRGRKPR